MESSSSSFRVFSHPTQQYGTLSILKVSSATWKAQLHVCFCACGLCCMRQQTFCTNTCLHV